MPPRARKLTETAKNAVKSASSPSKRGVKRKASPGQSGSESEFEESPTKRPRNTKRSSSSPKKASEEASTEEPQVPPLPKVDWGRESPTFLPAKLNFSYEDAKRHLISVDPRFAAMFEKLPCRPFVKLERVEPFRSVSSSAAHVESHIRTQNISNVDHVCATGHLPFSNTNELRSAVNRYPGRQQDR